MGDLKIKLDDCGITPLASRTILLVDDCGLDEELFRRALRRCGVLNRFHAVRSGEEAIEYLSHAGQYWNCADFPTPHVLVLDLEMQPQSGWEVLEWVRERPEFRGKVVIMLGGGGSEAEADDAFRLGANACLPKPPETREFEAVVERIGKFWLLTDNLSDITQTLRGTSR